METFLWLVLALPVTDNFFTNLILVLVAPVIVVAGGLLVVASIAVFASRNVRSTRSRLIPSLGLRNGCR